MDISSFPELGCKRNCYKKYSTIKSQLVYGVPSNSIPDFSIIIPTYKRADTLKEALESALCQKINNNDINFEVLVIDNCGGKEIDFKTDQLMREYTNQYSNLYYYRNELNIGWVGNWNRCFELCRTEWFCMLHDDDILKENYVEKIYPAIKPNGYGMVGAYCELLDERVGNTGALGYNFIIQKLISFFLFIRHGKLIPIYLKDATNGITWPSPPPCAFNKEKGMSLGGFDESWKASFDAPFYWEIIDEFGAAFLPEKLAIRRIATNATTKKEVMLDVIEINYDISIKICKKLYKSNRTTKKISSRIAVIVFLIFPGAKYNVDFHREICEKYHISRFYEIKLIQLMISLWHKLHWGFLLLRK